MPPAPVLAVLLAACAAGGALAGGPPLAPPGASVDPPPRRTRPAPRAERARVRIVNRYFGAIAISRDEGRTWTRIGKVLRPVHDTLHPIQDREFTAADWAPVGSVAATAVNALHLKVSQDEPHATVFSVLPHELATSGPAGSYRDSEASILTDVPAGTGIFGAEAAPRVGDALMLERPLSGRLEPWPEGRAPKIGDRVVLRLFQPVVAGGVLEIENRWGGPVTWTVDGVRRVVARVYRPLAGSGRFGGTVYQGPGKVRANHPGVLCVSTSPHGVLGGFQVVPCFHANDPALVYVQSTTAYLVVGPANLDDPALEGLEPLYLGTFRPGDQVEARVDGAWGPLPVVEMKKALGLSQVEALRFLPSR